jgi:hypothetical protein
LIKISERFRQPCVSAEVGYDAGARQNCQSLLTILGKNEYKQNLMNTIHFLIIFTISLITINPALAQNDCKVLLDSIAGQYHGGCKKGLADGVGTAKGIDTYIGEFKKGLPHGKGKYTWANGNVYDGQFKNGLKESKGTLTIQLSDGKQKVQTGYWSQDKYTGEFEHPYEIISRSVGVISVRVTPIDKKAEEADALIIQISDKGRIQQKPDVAITMTFGSLMSAFPIGVSTKVIIGTFPVGFMLHYKSESLEFRFNQQGSYDIKIDFNKGIKLDDPNGY